MVSAEILENDQIGFQRPPKKHSSLRQREQNIDARTVLCEKVETIEIEGFVCSIDVSKQTNLRIQRHQIADKMKAYGYAISFCMASDSRTGASVARMFIITKP
jgi:hypothetical protein